MKILKKNPKGRDNSRKSVKKASLLILTLIFALLISGIVSAGTPLVENQTGTVSGDLYVNTTNPWSSTTQGATNEVTQANTLPAYTSIDSAMVYVNVYSGSGTNNWPVRTTIKLDGNGDGDYDDPGELLGVEDMNIPGTTDGTVYWLNDHCNRVYSDYQVWYDVKNLITNNPTLYVKTETLGGDGYDGRIKMLTLCVAYNDGDTDKVDYWVLNGQDWINTGSSTSTFNTHTISGQVSSATLNTVALSGTDGTYTLNTNTLTGNLTETGSYYKEHRWDVTTIISSGADTNLTYTNVGASFKISLSTLTIIESALPMTDFTVTTTSGKASLTVTFTDNSTGATGWLWDFGDGTTSNDENPTHTYSTLGSYTVKLTATNNAGSNTTTKTGYITVTATTGINWTTKTTWNTPDVGSWAVPCLVDLDGDGDHDLLIGAADGVTYGYENTGTTNSPVWTAKTTWNTPDVGSGAAICCADLDGDGDHDLLIGTTGNSVMVAYENTGTASSPVWTAKTTWDINVGTFSKACCADLDGDGDHDLLIGNNSGVMYAYENTGTATSPMWTAKPAWNLSGLPKLAKPCCADLDGDGDYDLLIGTGDGVTFGYENTGTATNPVWTANSLLNTLDIGNRAAPILADLDSDGDHDLLIGENGGVCYGYENAGVLVSSPDLTPITVNPVTLTVNKLWTVTATVKNASSVKVGGFVATMSVDGIVVDTQSVLGPNASSSSTVNFFWTPTTTGTYNLMVTVDPSGNISETDETNNTLTVPVSVVVDTQAPTVTATPLGGNLTSSTQVTLSATDNYDTNPKIYYTTEGTDPTTSSTLYANPISISKTTTLKFIAVDFSGNISPVQTETYTDSEAPTTTANPKGGNSTSTVQVILSATDNVTSNPIIYYTTNGTDPTTTNTVYTNSILITSTTILKFISVDDNGNISPMQSETYTINDTEAPTVTASPAGGTYTSKTDVTLTVTDNIDPNPVIYYSLDGTSPTTNSTRYTDPLIITSNNSLKFIGVDATGNISTVQTETYTMVDTETPTATASLSGTTVTLSATDNMDPNPTIYYTTDGTDPTSNSTPYSDPFTIPRAATTVVRFIAVDASGNTSPVQSKTYNTTYLTDLLTSYNAEGHVGVIVDNGGTGYHGGDPVYNLSLPADATILAAHLYIAWNWYGYFPSTVSFNGHTFTGPNVHYVDGNDGQDMFDVTQYFNLTGPNTAQIINGNSEGVYGRTLIVVYQSATEPYRKIWVNEGYDIIPSYGGYGATEGPGHAFFNNVTTDNISSVEVIITVPSGDNDSPNILLNGQTFTINSTGGSDPSFKYYNITPTALQNGTNTLEVPNGGYMSLANAILTLTMNPVADFTATPTTGTTPLQVTFTDQSTDATSYEWDFNNDGNVDSTDQNPIWTYNTAGTYTVKLTATGPGGTDEETKTSYITVNEPAPVAQFVAVSTSGSSPLTVAFTDQSTNTTEWSWDFNNDGTVDSTDQNPTWIYDRPGTYTVKLSVTGPGGTDEVTKTDYIIANKSTQPDLLAKEMKVTNSSYINYSLVEVSLTNIGLKTTGFFNVTLYDNGTQVGEQYTYWMASDKDRSLYFIWSPSTIGEHNLQVIVDKNDSIQESNENNNQITLLVDNRPDLTPTALKAKSLPLNYCYVTVDVTNNGEDLTEFYDVTLYDNGAQIGQQKIYGLKTGETETITFLCKLTNSSTHNLQATTDATSTIPETDETNNTLTQQL